MTSGIGAASMLKFVPIIGTITAGFVMPVLSAGATYAIGKAFIQHFASGGTLLDFNAPDYRGVHQGAEGDVGLAQVRRSLPAPKGRRAARKSLGLAPRIQTGGVHPTRQR